LIINRAEERENRIGEKGREEEREGEREEKARGGKENEKVTKHRKY